MGKRRKAAVANADLMRRLRRIAFPDNFVAAELVEGPNGAAVLHTMLEMSPADMARLQAKRAAETAIAVAERNGARLHPRVATIKAGAKR